VPGRFDGGYLDWLNLDDPTPADVLDTAFVAKSTRELAQMAKAIGRGADAAAYQARYEAIRAAYQQAFIATDGSVKGDSQTAYILTLTNDLEPEDRREAVYDQFVQTLERRDYHLSTGFLGVDGLLPALTKAGRTDIAYRLLQHQDYPSWGYEIGKGATTIWERWNSINPDGTFNDVGMNSFNHYAYGAVGEWMYRTMAGVSAAEPGYRKITIAPEPGDGVDDVDYSLQTPYGTVRSAWATDDGPMTLDVTVPANTTAEVRIPAANRWAVAEGGAPIEDSQDVEFVRDDGDEVVLEVGSGDYSFAVAPALGDLGAARAQAAATATQVSALRLDGPAGSAAKRDLTKRTALLRGEIDGAWDLAARDTEEEQVAEAVHRALAAAANLDRGRSARSADGDREESLPRFGPPGRRRRPPAAPQRRGPPRRRRRGVGAGRQLRQAVAEGGDLIARGARRMDRGARGCARRHRSRRRAGRARLCGHGARGCRCRSRGAER
jgi:hypothetical protein